MTSVQNLNIASGDHVKFNKVSQIINSKISLDTITTYSNISGVSSLGRFGLKYGSTYKLHFNPVQIDYNANAGNVRFGWYDVTTSTPVMIGTAGSADNFVSNVRNDNGIIEVPFTPTVDSQVELRIISTGDMIQIGDATGGNFFPYAVIEETSRQSTIINTSEYLNVSRVNSDVTGVGANSDLIFNSLVSGNMPYSTTTGVAILTAGKIYELMAEPMFFSFTDTAGGYVIFDWVDATTNQSLVANGQGVGTQVPINRNSAESGSGIAHITYTPTTNQKVKIRVTQSVGTTTFRSGIGSRAIIKQIGSTACANIPTNLLNPDVVTTTGNQTLTNKNLDDTSTFIVDTTDNTKKLNFNVGGTTGVTGTIASTFTTAKTITLPDATGTVALIDIIYPVGHIIMTENSANPATYLGVGTWSPYGAGKVPVGIDSTQTEFNALAKTGGEKAHILSVAEMPSHNHINGRYTKLMTTCQNGDGNVTGGTGDFSLGEPNLFNSADILSSGGNGSHNNLQPYIVCYMWKRMT
jgi:hypothetical protein